MCRIITAVRLTRLMIATLAALAMTAGAAFLPFVALHEMESHGRQPSHHHAEHSASRAIASPDHAHGGHDHPTLRLADAVVHGRTGLGVSVAPVLNVTPLFARAAMRTTATVSFRPQRSRHPLSVSGVLRI